MPQVRKRRRSKRGCPICGQEVKPSDAEFPFCSERCRLLDLGRWLNGIYRVPTGLADSLEAAPDISDDDSGERD
jgi:uncharacterized protein